MLKTQLKQLGEILEVHADSLPKPVRVAVRKPVRLAVRTLLREISTAWRVEYSNSDFQALKEKNRLKVNLGCGSDIRAGFVNIDLERRHLRKEIDSAAHPDTMFITFDLRLGLPLEDHSCDFIYSSHFFEHLDYEYGLRLMRDCYRALRPKGVFRIALPNPKVDFDAYLRGDDKYLNAYNPLDLHDPHLTSVVEAETMTRVDWINYAVYQSGEHKYIYDEEKVILLLEHIGFSSVSISSYLEGIDIDEPIRRDCSFYVEAVK